LTIGSFLPWTVMCLAVVAHRRRLLRSSFLLVSAGLLVLFLAETGLLTRPWVEPRPRPRGRGSSSKTSPDAL
jgi:hypothetical protein